MTADFAEHRESRSVLSVFGQQKMAAILLLGFASGFPLYLTGRTLQAWLTVESVDLSTIGLFSLVTLPYSLKFLWAPFIDRYVPPFLGRRRGWLIITQIALLLAIGAMGLHDPTGALQLLAFNAVLIAFFSASQDVVFDAYRIDVLDEREMGVGAALGVLGYRVALIVTGSVAFVLADRMPWSLVYALLSLLMLVGILATLRAPDPIVDSPPRSIRDAIVEPFLEFFNRTGAWLGTLILLFIIAYQLPDRFAQNMATPFLLQVGFSQTEIGAIQGGIGMVATIVGVLAGGALVARLGLNRSGWIAAGLQILSNLVYYWIALAGADQLILVLAVIIENVSGGMVTAVFVALLMSLCSRRYSATQFALLSSLMAAARDVIVAPAGLLAAAVGWPVFFLLTLAMAVPSLVLLPMLLPWRGKAPRGAAVHTGEVRTDGGQGQSDSGTAA